jgi:hypothetical protein
VISCTSGLMCKDLTHLPSASSLSFGEGRT